MAITYRTAGAWGAGKGADLTAPEIDSNFYELLTRAANLETNPATPTTIQSIELAGAEFTITTTDAVVHGPFTIPINAFAWTGEWTPSTEYAVLDTFYVEGRGVYYVVTAHTSDAEFDPLAAGSESEILYQKLVADTSLYDMSYYLPGVVGDGLGASTPLMQVVFTRDVWIMEDTSEAPTGYAYLRTADTGGLEIDIQKNAVSIGTLTFAAAANVGVFTIATSTLFEPGDVLALVLTENANTETAQDTEIVTESDTVLTTELITEWVTETHVAPDGEDLSITFRALRSST